MLAFAATAGLLWGCGDTPALGAPCTDGCGDFACLEHPSFPGGVCTQVCGTCPAGSACTPGFGPAVCLPVCSRNDDCDRGFQCFSGVCRPPCTLPAECGDDRSRCIEGACVPPACADSAECRPGEQCLLATCTTVPGGGLNLPTGNSCARAIDCESAICLDAARGGTCAAPCVNRSGCGFDEVCAPVPIDLDGDGRFDAAPGACLEGDASRAFVGTQCADDTECETLTCVDGLCTEGCGTTVDCLGGWSCVEALVQETAVARVCGFAPLAGAVRTDRVELGVTTATGSGSSESRFLAVPTDAVSVTLLGTVADRDRQFGFNVVRDPTATVYSVGDLLLWNDQPVRWVPQDTFEQIQMVIPNSTPDRILLRPGRLDLSVFSFDGATEVELAALIKRSPTLEVDRGTLDLNVFLVGVGLGAAEASSDPRLQGALDELRAIYQAASITIGRTEYFEIGGSDAAELSVLESTVGPGSELTRLLRLSAGRTETAVNVFLVRGILEMVDGSVALGVAGGIPGPPAIHGTGHSGVVVSFDPTIVGTGPDSARVVGQIMAHEIGHYLGLFHTRERETPCVAGTGPTAGNPCAPFGGEDVVADTAYDDGENLMWFALGGADGRTFNTALSLGQGFVMRRNPVVLP